MHHHHDADHQGFDSPEKAAYAALEGEALLDLTGRAIATAAAVAEQRDLRVRRVLDLGCGPGVGTTALAQRFGGADVVAVDDSATMLDAAAARVADLGLAGRVTTRRAALPDDLGALDPADVVWASMVLHHVGDEVEALRLVRALLTAGGVLAVVERAEGGLGIEVRCGDAEPTGLWDRLDAAWAAAFDAMRAALPGSTPSADVATMAEAAGFEVLADEVLALELAAPLAPAARQLAHRHLAHTRTRLADHLDADDRAALDALVDEGDDRCLLHRDDVTLRTARRLVVAC